LAATVPSLNMLIALFISHYFRSDSAGFFSPGNLMITVTAPDAGAIDVVAARILAL